MLIACTYTTSFIVSCGISWLILDPLVTVQETNSDSKLSDISSALSTLLQQQCSFSLSVQQSLFSCLGTTDSQTVVFLAQLSYTALPGVDMPSLLTSWVASSPYVATAAGRHHMSCGKLSSCLPSPAHWSTHKCHCGCSSSMCHHHSCCGDYNCCNSDSSDIVLQITAKVQVCSIAHHTTLIHDCQ